jgi:hypothetical protein
VLLDPLPSIDFFHDINMEETTFHMDETLFNIDSSGSSDDMPLLPSSPSQTPKPESYPEEYALTPPSSPSLQSSPPVIPQGETNLTEATPQVPIKKAAKDLLDEVIGLRGQVELLRKERDPIFVEVQEQQLRRFGLQEKYPARTSGLKKEPQQEVDKENSGDLFEEPETKDDTEKPGNARAKNRTKFKPQNHYILPPMQSRGYLWASQASGRAFYYTKQGELDPQTRYSEHELEDFLYFHFLHETRQDALARGQLPTKASQLVLWIQHTPSDVAHRYPTKESSRCRFANCLDPKGGIRNGHFRICFDEWNYDPNSWRYDPYHNAGYVHLYCLEYFCDFPTICQNLNVQGDNRTSKISKAEGINRFTIIRDRPELLDVCNDFIENSQSWPANVRKDGANNSEWYKTTLSHALTTKHLELQTDAKRRTRQQRNGNSIDKHLNNLHDRLELEKQKRQEAAAARKANGGRTPKPLKRKAVEDDEEDVLDSDPFGSGEEQHRVIKKPRPPY